MDLKERTSNGKRHPWELSRTRNLIQICRKTIVNKNTISIGDIGAGDRYFDNQLIEKLKNDNIEPVIYAIDNKYENTISEQKEIVILNDISMLEKNSMDCIVMMDVLEHIKEDNKFLKLVLERLKENGILIVTVPAFEILFSSHDIFLKHFRRYNYRGLQKLLLANNLQIIRSHYFYSSLCIVRWLQIKLKINKPEEKNVGIGMWKYSQKNIITRSIDVFLDIDFKVNIILNKFGIRLPGLSLLAVSRKKDA
jgi:SAM-dependent methyltransferase